MVKRISKGNDGKYHVKGKSFEMLIGSRAQVYHGTAFKTKGELTKSHLMMNKHGRIVSVKKHNTAKREKRLIKAGYYTRKGKFGFVYVGSKTTRTRRRGVKAKRSRRRRAGDDIA